MSRDFVEMLAALSAAGAEFIGLVRDAGGRERYRRPTRFSRSR